MQFSAAIPLLRIFDENLARAFYLDYLGFNLDWEHRFEADLPVYMQISRDELKLHLTAHYGDCSPAASVFIPMQQIEDFHQQLQAQQHQFSRPGLESQPWGLELELIDPFANRLKFSQAED